VSKEKQKNNLFQRLTRLFRSGPVVKRKIRGLDTTIAVTDKSKSSAALLFQRSVSPTYSTITANSYNLSERLMRYQDFCFTGDTLVATPDEIGSARIDNIVERWESGDRDLWTFSYDVDKKSVVAAKITNAKCNGIRKIVSVTLDDRSVIRCTPDHRFMLKDASYVEAQDLQPGTALMRFGHVDSTLASCEHEDCKVVSVVDYGESELVYDIEVAEYSNFALAKKDERLGAQGIVIVHNCEMEYTPEIASALDIYADETCSQDEKGRVLHIFSENEKIKQILEDLFYNTLNVEFNLRSWARNLVKYGDFFLYNDVSPTQGVINAFPIPVNEIEREENYDREDPFAVRYRWTTMGNRTLENWEVTHFRYIGNDMFLPYGSSVIEAARRIWRQLILLEDAMLVYRVVRAPERRVFYLDVANIPPESVPTYVEEQRKNLRTNQVVDRNTGRVDLRYSPLSVEDDYFIPVRGGESGTRIDTLAGGQNAASVEDVAYIQKKLFAALKIPRAYLGYDEMLSSKATLAQEDIRFSRTINVIQKTLLSEMNKLAIIHLYAHGFDNEDLQNFTLRLSNPSTVAQQQKLELWRSKFEIGGALPEGMGSKQFIQKEIWGLNDEQIATINEQRKQEKVTDAEVEAASSGTEAEPAAGGAEEETPAAGEEETGGEEAGGGGEAGGGLFAGDEPADDAEPGAKLLLSIDDEDVAMPNLYEKDKLPVKKTNQAKYSNKKAQYDSSRRKKWQLHEPDFVKIASTHQSLEDPYDKSWLSNQFKDPLGLKESRTSERTTTSLPPDVMSSLKKMSTALRINREYKKDALLTETADIDIDIEK